MTDPSPIEWTQNGPVPLSSLLASLEGARASGKRIITTNGCFDLLHVGHIHFLDQARALGDILIVGLNSDDCVTRLKGPGRPILPLGERAALLLALRSVDHVVVFDDLLPNALLDQIRPDLHCKAGDYTAADLPEAQVVEKHGGQVRILPHSGGQSTSRLVERITSSRATHPAPNGASRDPEHSMLVLEYLLSSSNVLRQSAYRLTDQIVGVAERLVSVLEAGGKVLLCGNGGSAADAQHIAADLVGRFRLDRKSLAALALTTDTSILTAVGNDYGFDWIFARQVSALGSPGDILIALSTSGKSNNVLRALQVARERGLYTIGLTGSRVSPMLDLAHECLRAPSEDTPIIQQVHLTMLHAICEWVERYFVHSNETMENVSLSGVN